MAATSINLLSQLRDPTDSLAWERFIDLYTPLIFHWAHERGLATDDAADLIQDVMVTILQRVHEFDPNGPGRFRGWLKTITANRIVDHCRRKTTRRETEPSSLLDNLAEVTESDLWDDQQYRLFLANRILELLRPEFKDTTWEAGFAQLVKGQSARDVANALGISVNAAYIAKSRLLARVRDHLEGLLD